jgi:hypothetical protein
MNAYIDGVKSYHRIAAGNHVQTKGKVGYIPRRHLKRRRSLHTRMIYDAGEIVEQEHSLEPA